MIVVSPGIKLRIKDRSSFATQTLVTLSSLMLKYDEEITDAAYSDRLAHNGLAVWLRVEPMVLSSRRLPQAVEVEIGYGDEILIEVGRKEERGAWLVAPPLVGDACRLVRRES
jgi:hypothetical protein